MCISIFTCFMAACSEIEPLSLTVKIAALAGGVGGILGLIIISQSVVIVILLRRLKKRYKSK